MMPDADRVIKGLIACTSESSEGDSWHNHEICPYVEDCATKNVGIGMPVMFDALALLKEQEAVIRCKDCEHCYFASNRIPSEQNYACGKHGFDVVPDWYCADGERKPTQTNAKNNALDVR